MRGENSGLGSPSDRVPVESKKIVTALVRSTALAPSPRPSPPNHSRISVSVLWPLKREWFGGEGAGTSLFLPMLSNPTKTNERLTKRSSSVGPVAQGATCLIP